MRRAWLAVAIGLGVSLILAMTTVVMDTVNWAFWMQLPGVALTNLAVGITQMRWGWNRGVAWSLMLTGNTLFYGLVSYLAMSLKAWWRA